MMPHTIDMTVEKAREILKRSDYIVWNPEKSRYVEIDGHFSENEIAAIFVLMITGSSQ